MKKRTCRIVVNPSLWLDLNMGPSGIPGAKTFEIYQTMPLAQTIRAQRILQLTLPPTQLLDISRLIGKWGAE